MKKNIIFFLVKCELGIPHLKNTSKDIIKLSFFSLILLLNCFNLNAQFTSGNIVVLQIGNGASLTSNGNPIILREYNTSGSATYQVSIPSTGANPLINSGTATSEGGLSLSANNNYLVFAGYASITWTSSISGATSANVNRGIGIVDASGTFTRVSTSSSFYSGNNIRSAASDGLNNYWSAGGIDGTNYFGTASSATNIQNTNTNTRCIITASNNLYFSTGSGTPGIYKIGTGYPVTSGQTTSIIITSTGTSPSPYAFCFNPTQTICYVADDRNIASGGGIQKWTYSGASWTLAYTFSLNVGNTYGTRGVIADFSGANPIVYATTTESALNRIVKIVDTGSGSTAITLATSASNCIFRGIAFSPTPPPTISSFSPSSACTGGTVQITGTNFTGASAVTIGGTAVTSFVVNSATQITAVLGPGTTGLVSVTTGAGSANSSGNLTVNSNPSIYAVTGTGSYCAGGTGVAVGLANSQSGVNYQLYNGASTVGSVVAGSGSVISFGLQTTATTYTVVGTNTTSSCESNMSGNAVITVTQLTAQITGANTICAGNSSTLSLMSGVGASNALNFDGVNDYMATNFDCDVNIVPVTTWEAWVYPTAQNGNWQMIMSIEDGGWDRFIAINNLNVYLGYGCNGWNPTSLTLNQWQHIAVVYNEPANQIIFYKNGVAYPYTIPGGCTHSSAVKYTLACSTQGSPGQFFAGSLDEVRVWNVARTQAQIVANMSVTIPSNSSGLVLNYQFNEGTGVNTANLVGAAYTGTLTNGPTWQVPSTAPITSPVVSTYTWSTGANTSSITINPTVTTSYSVAFTTTAGCIGTSPLATVNVNPLPVVSISGSSAICVGETATLVANGANTYTWSNASTASSITLSPASNTSYSLTGTAAGCIGLATTNLTVNANPIITVNSGAICAGQNFTINPNGANTYTIQGGNSVVSPAANTSYTVAGTSTEGCLSQAFATSSLTVNANPIITVNNGVICAGQNFTINPNGANTYTIQGGSAVVSPTSNASFTVAGTSASGCVSQAFATSNLTVNPNPTITVNNGTICAGQNFTINPNGANTYTIQGGNAVVSPASNTNYTVFGSSTEGCVSQAFATSSLIVNPNPIITVNNGTICAGQNFTINPNGASTYTIQGGNAIVSPSSNTNFTVAGTSTEGCLSQAFATSSLIVNPNPTITVNNGTICAGQNFTINPNGANTYTIQGNNSVVSPPSNTSFTVAGTSASGCLSQSYATSSLTVNPNPTVSISGSSGICTGQNASLTASGATNYTWSTGSNNASIVTTPSVNTIYTLTGSSSQGCSSFTTQLVTVQLSLSLSIAGPTSVCYGQAVNLSGLGGVTYTWNTGATSSTIAPTLTTTTTFSVIGASGTCSNTAITTISVIPNPIITVNNGAICSGQNFTINPNGANTYTIQGGNAVVSPSINTTYSVVGTSTAGCVSQAFATSNLTVNPNPIITVNNGTICAGQNFTINPSGANTYTIQGGNPVVSPPSNTTFTVIGTNSVTGCRSQSFATSSLVVNANPIITVNNGTICSGQNFTINPNGANTYTIQGGNAVVSPPSNAIFTVAGTSTAGCVSQAVATSSLIVNQNPTITVNNGAICAGQNFTINPNGANTYTIQGANAVVSPSVNTTYTVIGTNTITGCVSQAFATSNLTVNPNPTVSISGASGICTGQNASLTANGATTYTWSTGSNSASIVTTPSANTTYTLTGSTPQGCSSFTTQLVTVQLSLSVSIAGPTTICYGQAANLSGLGGVTYTWNTGATTATVAPTLTTTTTFSLIGASGTCSNTAIKTISVTPNPTVTITGTNAICANGSTSLTVNGATTYTWSSGSTSASVVFSPSATSVYSVVGSYSTGCLNATTQTVTVYALPVVSISGPSVVCLGDSIALVANGANTYVWNNNATTTTIVITPTTTSTYSAVGTDTNGCVGLSASKSVTVNPLPILSIISTATAICAGDTVKFTAAGANSYAWNIGDNDSLIVVTPTITTTYSVVGTNGFGCTSTKTDSVKVNTLPNITISGTTGTICIGENITLTANGANTYTWSGGINTNSIAVSPSVSTTYSASGTSTDGCVGSNTLQLNVTECTNIKTIASKAAIKVYPNPNNGEFTIELTNINNSNITITNVLGQIIKSQKAELMNQIDLNAFDKGIYFINVMENNQSVFRGSIIKQ